MGIFKSIVQTKQKLGVSPEINCNPSNCIPSSFKACNLRQCALPEGEMYQTLSDQATVIEFYTCSLGERLNVQCMIRISRKKR